MWGDMFRDPWTSSFPRVQATGNPFVGFGGFYGERPRSFWEHPVYFPTDKPRTVSNRKKTPRRVEDDHDCFPARFKARENPSTKQDGAKLKEDEKLTSPSRPKLSQTGVDIPITILQPNDENILNGGVEETSNEAPCDRSNELHDRDQQTSVETTEESGSESASQVNHSTNDIETAKDSSSVVDHDDDTQAGMRTAEEQKLKAIKTEQARAKELIPRIVAFEGSREDREFLYLEEHLTRCILGLDLIEADGQEKVKSARKEAVKEILSIVNDLEASVHKE